MSSKTKTAKQTVEAEDKKFSPTIITNFLNNHYRNLAAHDPSAQSLTFKNYPADPKSVSPNTLANKPVIDLYGYQGLIDFIETYKLMPNEDYSKIIERVFDLKLHTCLDIADKYKTNDKKKLNVFQEFVIPQLGFGDKHNSSIQDFIDAINSFFENDAKIKTKIYNSVFPHDTHHQNEPPKGVNVIYLQHISKYHDEVLDMVINQNMKDSDVLIEIQKLYSKNYKFGNSGSITPEERERAITQMLNPKIAEIVLDPPTITDKKGNEVADPKWIEKLHVCEINRKTKKFVETNEIITKEEQKNIRELVRELSIVKSFVKIIRGGANARKIIKEKIIEKDEKGKEVEKIVERYEPMKVDFKFCLEQYNTIYEETLDFYDSWKKTLASEYNKIQINKEKARGDETDPAKANELVREEGERLTYELFLRYFIESVKFVKDKFNYSTPLKTFINDIKKDVVFKFNKNLRAKINEKIEQKEPIKKEEITELAKDYYKDWMFLNSPKTYDTNELSIYSKIGKFCNVPIKKDYRIAIGISIIAYIQEQIKLIRAAHPKKHEIQVFIRA